MPIPARGTRIVRQEAGGSRWEVAIRAPPAHLAPYIRDIMGYTEQTPISSRRRELPGPMVVVILEIGPPIRVRGASGRAERFPGGFVAGVDDGPTVCEHDGFQSGVQLNLTPVGARLFFGLPMSELTRRVVPFGDVVARTHADLVERLHDARTWDARFDLVERMLDERVAAPSDRARVVSWAVRRIEAAGGDVDMRRLARELGYSRKHVIDLFHDQVGVPPKLLARIVRFDALMRHLRVGGAGTWAELAQRFGYYDQAHLVREVRQFTGMTPTEARGTLIDFASFQDAEVNSVQDASDAPL
ncbi:MAG TPA: AraC family transcriptional regulator [Haliangiales bacterium]|nr:AraC family transcriptional regulator [Haliangiales bacterium]